MYMYMCVCKVYRNNYIKVKRNIHAPTTQLASEVPCEFFSINHIRLFFMGF